MAKVTVQFSVKSRMEKFFEYLKKRSQDKVHEGNKDLIADFIDKFIVVELKWLENNNEKFDEILEVPDEVMLEPLKQMKASFDKTFNDFLSGKGVSLPKKSTGAGEDFGIFRDPEEEFSTDDEEVTSDNNSIPNASNVSKPRTGNGHEAKKTRDLNDSEKDTIKSDFLALNGQFVDSKKSCQPILEKLGSDITIWQVVGFVSLLHRYIAMGGLQVPDLDAYKIFLEEHHKLWAQYNSSKYQTARQNASVSTTPRFSKRPFSKKTI